MKSFAAAAILAAATLPAFAQPVAQPYTGSTGPVCFDLEFSPDYPIKHTKVLDPQHVLFYMRDGKVWMNRLKTPCPGLTTRGFTFIAFQGEICSNAVGIKVIQTGETCTLGVFTPYTNAPPGAP